MFKPYRGHDVKAGWTNVGSAEEPLWAQVVPIEDLDMRNVLCSRYMVEFLGWGHTLVHPLDLSQDVLEKLGQGQ